MDWGQEWMEVSRGLLALGTRWGMRLFWALVLALLGWLVARWASGRAQRLAERTGKVDRTFVSLIGKITRVAVLAAALVAVLGQLGVDTASFLAFLGAAGLAIGLALKDTASDVAGGVVLLALRPFSVGDAVSIGTTGGIVEEIGVFQTTLISFEGVPVVVPNSRVRTSEIQNFTRAGKRRIDLTVGVAYDTDLDRVRAVLSEVVAADERVLADPPPLIDVSNLGESSIDFLVRVWVVPDSFFDARLALARAIRKRLDAEGIEIPFPQRVVHTVRGDAA
ncbi:MAG: mechanosensitive ion channel [Sandaracinaceae bacterium]|nr:mechanosensitive ion channel [Sandaracinaceae bacterium]